MILGSFQLMDQGNRDRTLGLREVVIVEAVVALNTMRSLSMSRAEMVLCRMN